MIYFAIALCYLWQTSLVESFYQPSIRRARPIVDETAITSQIKYNHIAFRALNARAKKASGDIKPAKEAKVSAKSKSKDALPVGKVEREELINDIVNELLSQLDKSSGKDLNRDSDDHDASAQSQELLLNSVIRVYCTHSEPNFAMPWQRLKQEASTSSGFVIDGNRILTNAHSVEYGSLIQVKKRKSENKYLAKVVAVGHECDLAILEVEDATFWEDLSPLKFGKVPDLLEDVSVIGYPVGGDSVSISSGIVSRIEMQEYAQASAELLAIQIDAAINPGNSGGPVVNNRGDVIGVAFQSLSEDDIENIGYVVPVSVIEHFLENVKRFGCYAGVCGLGIRLQGMENDKLRTFYGMKSTDTGVLVLSTGPLAPAHSILKRGDVILSIDGTRIANDGTIPFREGNFAERVQFHYYLSHLYPNDVVALDVLREQERMKINVPVWVPVPLIPSILLNRNFNGKVESTSTTALHTVDSKVDAKSKPKAQRASKVAMTNAVEGSAVVDGFYPRSGIVGGTPSYLLIGGLVFVTLTKEYIKSVFDTRHMTEMVSWTEEFKILSKLNEPKSVAHEEVVLLSQVIAHKCNIGYENCRNFQLTKLNGEPVTNLRQLKEKIDLFYRNLAAAVSVEASVVDGTLLDDGKKKAKSPAKSKKESTASSSGVADLVFEFSDGQYIILDAKQSLGAQDQICKEHLIPSVSSEDLNNF